jgi:hypothetical protein
MSTNGSRPRHAGRRMPGARRTRLAVGAAAALVIAAVLVAPVVLLGTGPKHAACSTTVLYRGQRYVARTSGRVVEAIALGVGVASGCGTTPANVDLRTVQGVSAARAVALASDSSTVYVRRGVCPGKERGALLRCLKGQGAAAASASLPR